MATLLNFRLVRGIHEYGYGQRGYADESSQFSCVIEIYSGGILAVWLIEIMHGKHRPLAQWRERAPYKRLTAVQLRHGLLC